MAAAIVLVAWEAEVTMAVEAEDKVKDNEDDNDID
jgi:hypothetical protein